MMKQTFNYNPSQKANNKGGNLNQVGRDYINTKNMSFVTSFFIIGVLALGGLAWSILIGWNPSSNPTLKPEKSSSTSVVEPNSKSFSNPISIMETN